MFWRGKQKSSVLILAIALAPVRNTTAGAVGLDFGTA